MLDECYCNAGSGAVSSRGAEGLDVIAGELERTPF